jgi:hypothetical protein
MVNSSGVLLQSLAESFCCATKNNEVRWYRKSNALNKLPLCIFYIRPDGVFRNKPKYVACTQQNSSLPHAVYPDRLGPSGKRFLTVILLHLFMVEILPQLSNTYNKLNINVVFVHKYVV